MSPLSPEARALLESAKGAGGPTPSQRTAMKRAVLAATLVPASAAALGGASTPAAAGSLGVVKLIAVVLVSAAVGAGATFTALRPAAAPVPTHTQPVVPPQKVDAPPQLPAPVEPVVEAPPPPPLEKTVVARPVVPVAPALEKTIEPAAVPAIATPEVPPLPLPPPPRVTPPDVPADDAALAKEVAALSGAMSDVDANRHQAALEKLLHYRAAFPSGALSTEAGVLEVLALCGLGRVDDAKAITFPSGAANNPALRRIENSCVSSQRNQKGPATQQVQGDVK